MIYLYHFLLLILSCLYPFIFCLRVLKGKEDAKRFEERLGIASISRPEGFLIWLHAASLGESIAALNLIEKINSKYFDKRSDLSFLISTGTLSSAQNLADKLPANAIHQFQPIDNILAVKNFFKHWQPDLGIFFESELWPALLSEGAKNCKLLLLNACMSDKSFHFWSRVNLWFPCPAWYFTEIVAQSIKDLIKFQKLPVKKVSHLGNIKFANKKLIFNEEKYLSLKTHFNDKRIIVFASTHPADEIVIFNILPELKKQYIDCYFILIPRHPHRVIEIIKTCQSLGLTCSLSSSRHMPGLDQDLYIVDEFGVLGLYYNLSYISFIGGSFNIGGHNILEPAHFAKLIIFGPDMSSCHELASQMLSAHAAVQISDQRELLLKLGYFLSEHGKDELRIISENAFIFVRRGEQIINDYLKIIVKYIDD